MNLNYPHVKGEERDAMELELQFWSARHHNEKKKEARVAPFIVPLKERPPRTVDPLVSSPIRSRRDGRIVHRSRYVIDLDKQKGSTVAFQLGTRAGVLNVDDAIRGMDALPPSMEDALQVSTAVGFCLVRERSVVDEAKRREAWKSATHDAAPNKGMTCFSLLTANAPCEHESSVARVGQALGYAIMAPSTSSRDVVREAMSRMTLLPVRAERERAIKLDQAAALMPEPLRLPAAAAALPTLPLAPASEELIQAPTQAPTQVSVQAPTQVPSPILVPIRSRSPILIRLPAPLPAPLPPTAVRHAARRARLAVQAAVKGKRTKADQRPAHRPRQRNLPRAPLMMAVSVEPVR